MALAERRNESDLVITKKEEQMTEQFPPGLVDKLGLKIIGQLRRLLPAEAKLVLYDFNLSADEMSAALALCTAPKVRELSMSSIMSRRKQFTVSAKLAGASWGQLAAIFGVARSTMQQAKYDTILAESPTMPRISDERLEAMLNHYGRNYASLSDLDCAGIARILLEATKDDD